MDAAAAHRQEIMEACMAAAQAGDIESFHAFEMEWNRLEDRAIEADPEHQRVVFGGDPIHYSAYVYCAHCDELWPVSGMSFGAVNGQIVVQKHMTLACESASDCYCWREGADGSRAACQECGLAFKDCLCADGPAAGPCVVAAYVLEQQIEESASDAE